MPKGTKKMRVYIITIATRKAKVGPNMMEEEIYYVSYSSLMIGNKGIHIRKMTHDHANSIVFMKSGR